MGSTIITAQENQVRAWCADCRHRLRWSAGRREWLVVEITHAFVFGGQRYSEYCTAHPTIQFFHQPIRRRPAA